MDARALSSLSCAWQLGPTRLVLACPTDSDAIAGAFERTSSPGLRRGSGGGAVAVGPGTLWMQLHLERSEHPADKLVNRHVRPLLRALTKVTSLPAHWFGRDWISIAHRPAAFVGFAHDASTGRVLIEAIVGVDAPFVAAPRGSFLGKPPATLAELAPRANAEALVRAIEGAYALSPSTDGPTASAATVAEPPWVATIEEAIGTIGAGPDTTGRLRVGGEFMASTDAIARLEAAIADGEDAESAVAGAFATGTLFGARASALARVIASALRAPTRAPL